VIVRSLVRLRGLHIEEKRMQHTEKPNTRRGFLLGATLGTAGAVAGAAAIVAGQSAERASASSAAAPDPNAATGYRMTPHIARYYETTQI
jgi:hypothetical protein